MNDVFNVNQYWLERGQNYMREGLPQEFHRLQEGFLMDVLRASRIPFRQILELGCGFGRVTRVLAEAFPSAKITAVDLSPKQIEDARQFCADYPNISFDTFDFYSAPAPESRSGYDAVIAVEVFLHHPRPVVLALFESLAAQARHFVNIDWSEEWPWKTAEHVWVHDYRALYAEAGLQCATFVLPQKVRGLQQKLFVAARQLSAALLHLEWAMQGAEAQARSATPLSAPTRQEMQEAAEWPQQVELAEAEICETVPPGSTIILVNEDEWGNEARALREYRVFPFLECEGLYWGPPDDDAMALSELDRLIKAGAKYIVFAWTSFWWLNFYTALNRRLRANCELIKENERLLIFKL